jgi:hypothetical protein
MLLRRRRRRLKPDIFHYLKKTEMAMHIYMCGVAQSVPTSSSSFTAFFFDEIKLHWLNLGK